MKKKTRAHQMALKKRRSYLLRFTAVSPTMLFRAVILLGALLVATIAILRGTTDPNAWTFLSSIVIYAALSKREQ